jgi:hypothetical protein
VQFNAITGLGSGAGTAGSSGTASAQYKRVGRVAICSWIIKT